MRVGVNIPYASIEGTSGPDLRLITCTSLINKLYVFRTRVFIHFITALIDKNSMNRPSNMKLAGPRNMITI